MTLQTPCPIWGTAADELDRKDGVLTVDSPRAGGRYKISGSSASMAASLPLRDKAIVTSWLVEQRLNGNETPEIPPDALEELRRRTPMSFSRRIDRALSFCEANISKIGEPFSCSLDDNDPRADELMAQTECQDAEELSALFILLGDTGLIKDEGAMGFLEFAPTPRGWIRIDEMHVSISDSAQAFVAMWFDGSTDAAYRMGIEPAIIETGYKPLRIDAKEHVNKIDDEIIAEIRRSRFLVADFTCEVGRVRGGVYFEAGYAMALGKPVIWTCKQSSMNDLHFDIRQFNTIAWSEPEELRQRLAARIAALMGDGPRRIARL